jgi:DNA-binding transcriptional LysR family regulator
MPGHLAALQVFFRVVEQRSFSAVARELRVTQPTVSRQVAALEAHLGVRLLTRTTRRVTPTGPGQALYERGAHAVRALLQAEDDIRTGESEAGGLVRLAMPGALGRHLVLPIVKEALAAQPGLTVELRLSDQVLDLVQAGIDFAVRVGRQSEASLLVRVVGASAQRFVAAPRYVRQHGRPRRMADLAAHALLLRAGAASRLGLSGRVALAADDVETVYDAVHAGLGVGILPLWLVADDLRRRRLVACVDDAPDFAAPVCLVRPATGWMPRRARALFDAVATGLTARLTHLAGMGGAGGGHRPGAAAAPAKATRRRRG